MVLTPQNFLKYHSSISAATIKGTTSDEFLFDNRFYQIAMSFTSFIVFPFIRNLHTNFNQLFSFSYFICIEYFIKHNNPNLIREVDHSTI